MRSESRSIQTGYLIGGLVDHYLFHAPSRSRRSASASTDHHHFLDNHHQVQWFQQQVSRRRVKRDFQPRDVAQQMSVTDPLWGSQWYLHEGAYGGHDMNVLGAWRKGYTGKNIVVTILDDGLEHQHQDLHRNYDPYASYDINNHDSDPVPRYDPSNENRHGTRCAGEVSAEANNTHCTIGIAPDSRIGGIRMLDGDVFDAVEAASLSFNRSHIDIYSASWGPDDDGKVVDGPGTLAMKAFIDGINLGREGKGSIFVWASGNGGSARDSCNCDGYTNSIFTLSISSTSEKGMKPWYLEECSSTLATTYSSGAYSERQIATTDLHNRCTTSHTGTSASAPLAAGIIALVLEANNQLTWRDVQYITLMTARPEPIRDGQWVTNALGRKVSLRYGYGLMDASAMVDLALDWINVPQKHECVISSPESNVRLPPKQPYSSRLEISACVDQPDHVVNFLEHVQARISLTFYSRGQTVIYLTSPSGTRSKLLPARPSDTLEGGFEDWPFLSVHFWGERPHGIWTLDIEDAGGNSWGSGGGGGTLISWSLVLHGTASQPVHLKNSSSSSSSSTSSSQPTSSTKQATVTVKPSTLPPSKCHTECKDEHCTGHLPQDCQECKHFRLGSTCVPECPSEYYVTEGDPSCRKCAPSCATCTGPSLVQCLSCPPGHQLHKQENSGGKTSMNSFCSPQCLPGYFLSKKSLGRRGRRGRPKPFLRLDFSHSRPSDPVNPCCCYCCCFCFDVTTPSVGSMRCCCYRYRSCSVPLMNKLAPPLKPVVTSRPRPSIPTRLLFGPEDSHSPSLDFRGPPPFMQGSHAASDPVSGFPIPPPSNPRLTGGPPQYGHPRYRPEGDYSSTFPFLNSAEQPQPFYPERFGKLGPF
ncbi:furin-like prohormone convertase [Plakobranchus ocellatus]|uniref:Furin-like prohormone convertase n=1 Tax=Plakobranchus ocellatus TaxID=259542 RepID=A0AAV4CWG3_9GAST|nr:furin-like prohormone convertase [Plakobranchus ocellatus]